MADLDDLLALQRVDTALDQLRHRRATLAEREDLSRAVREMADAQAAASLLATELAAATQREAELSAHAVAASARLIELERRAKVVTTTKESDAVEHERGSVSARRAEVEDQQLEMMERLEQLGLEMEANAQRIENGVVAEVNAQIALEEVEATMNQQGLQLAADRERLAAAIAPAMLERYETMRVKLGGVAVAVLENGHCSGCRLQLSSGELDRLRHHEAPDAMVTCEQCGRLLVR